MPDSVRDRVFRPAVPGCAIAVAGGRQGTFGCVVQDRDGAGVFYLLTAAHVIASTPAGDPLGLPVLQPGTLPGAGQAIGAVAGWGAIEFDTGTLVNVFDAAIARVAASAVRPEIIGLGRPQGINMLPAREELVRKMGAASGSTEGRIVDTDYSCRLRYRGANGKDRIAGFQQQLLCVAGNGRDFSVGGDSGAVVLDARNAVVGIVIGATDDGSVVSPIGPILQELRVAIA